MGIDELRGAVRGTVFLPGDEGFDQAARPWNVAVTQSVAAVVQVADADDIAGVVRYARRAGRTVVTQPTGHGATGDIENAILVRTGKLDSIAIDPDRRLARVGSGAQWGRVQSAAAAHGLSGLAGSNPVVGVTGYTLGGGFGWLARAHGWAANAVRAIDLVDAAGERTHPPRCSTSRSAGSEAHWPRAARTTARAARSPSPTPSICSASACRT